MENTFGFGEFRAAPESPRMTTGICDHCKHFSIKEWDETGGPVCTFFKKCLEIDITDSPHIIKSCIAFSSTDYKYCTKGNLDVRTIEVGDIQYEYEYNFCIKSIVKTKPVINENEELINWENITENGKIIKYSHNINSPHYSINLYNYEAYPGRTII